MSKMILLNFFAFSLAQKYWSELMAIKECFHPRILPGKSINHLYSLETGLVGVAGKISSYSLGSQEF